MWKPDESELPGQPRTARQWLADFGWSLEAPTEDDKAALDQVMEHDEFWEWAAGKATMPALGNTTWRQTGRDVVLLLLLFGASILLTCAALWLRRD